jgi:putative transposase
MMKNGALWQTWWRKRNHLDAEAYQGPCAFSVTVSTWQRAPVFTEPSEVTSRVQALEDAARQHWFAVLAYCFMPDHLHLLVEGSDGSDLSRFMKAFKQTTSFHHKERTGKSLWQRSYYDHVIRNEEDEQAALAYILENPVRAGLVENFDEYPFLGGVWVREMLVAT